MDGRLGVARGRVGGVTSAIPNAGCMTAGGIPVAAMKASQTSAVTCPACCTCAEQHDSMSSVWRQHSSATTLESLSLCTTTTLLPHSPFTRAHASHTAPTHRPRMTCSPAFIRILRLDRSQPNRDWPESLTACVTWDQRTEHRVEREPHQSPNANTASTQRPKPDTCQSPLLARGSPV